VVRGVLQLGRSQPPAREPHSLQSIVDAALSTIADQAAAQHVAIEPVSEISSHLAPTTRAEEMANGMVNAMVNSMAHENKDDAVYVDASAVQGALLNVLLNALHAMPDGGTLVVGCRVENSSVVLRVGDSGNGIAAEAREALFRPFYTTRDSGTGLGLPLARRAIEDSGGTLTLAEPQPERGAEFVFTIPCTGVVQS